MKQTDGTPTTPVRVSASVTVKHDTTKGQLELATANIPDDARISMSAYVADRPGESSYSTITYTWTI